MMWWGHDNWGAGSWIAMSLTMLVFWALFVGLIVWVVRSMANKPATTGTGQPRVASPDDVLADRFARGDINEDEFTRRRALLHAAPGSSPPA